MKHLTYLIYIVLWEGFVFGGAWYTIFILGNSYWWALAALLLGSCAYSPLKWIHGVDAKENDK